MQARSAGAALAAIAVLCCTACGSTHAAQPATVSTTHVAHDVPLTLPPDANLVIVPTQHGAGNEQFGTFTASGTVYFEFSCRGKGPLTIPGILQHISPCDGSPTGASVPYHAGERAHIAVQAKPGTTWRLAVGEHVPGASLLLVHSSGDGNKSFGPFRAYGRITVDVSCTGTGNFDIAVFTASPNHNTGIGRVCPAPAPASSLGPFHPAGGRVRFEVHAAPKAHWTIAVREQFAK